jgi:hypothetical protein
MFVPGEAANGGGGFFDRECLRIEMVPLGLRRLTRIKFLN